MAFFLAPRSSPMFLGILGTKVGMGLPCVLGDVASRLRLYLAAKRSHVGVNVDGLACPLYCSMACSRQTRGQDLLLGAILSCLYSWRSCLFGGCEAPGIGYYIDC
jgi:hypothetical protein